MAYSSSKLKLKALRGVAFIALGQGLQSVCSLAVLATLARLLSPDDFGVLGIALAIVGFSNIFSQIGIGPAIVQMIDLSQRHVHTGFTLSLLLGFSTGAVVTGLSPWISEFFRMPVLENILPVLAFVFPLTGVSVVAQSVLQRNLRFKALAMGGITAYALGYGGVGVYLAFQGFGVWSLVGAHLCQVTLATVIWLFLEPKTLGWMFRKKEFGELANFGMGFTLAKIANYGASQFDNLVVGRMLGPAALGIYGRAYQCIMLPTVLIGTVSDKVLFPAMASVQKDIARLGRAYSGAVGSIAMVSLPLSGIAIVLGKDIITVVLGPQWAAVSVPFQILACVLVFRISYKISDALARSTGAVYRRAWRQWVYAGGVLIGAWVGQFWGIRGVAWGVSVAIFINFLLMLQLSMSLTVGAGAEIFKSHFRHFVIAAFVSGLTWVVLRQTGADTLLPIPRLILGTSIILGCYGLILRGFPRLLGTDLIWLFELLRPTLGKFFPESTMRVVFGKLVQK